MPINTTSANMANANKLMAQVAINDVNPITKGSWLNNSDKIDKVKCLKDLACGNCRLLYGSERFRFYDIVVCEDEKKNIFAALLTCNQEGSTKILRNAVDECPVEAVRILVEQLQRDTAKLFAKYTVGCQIKGQQGTRDIESGTFILWKEPRDERCGSVDDDTGGLVRKYWDFRDDIPKGPWADVRGSKRFRKEVIEDGFRKADVERGLRENSEEGGLPY